MGAGDPKSTVPFSPGGRGLKEKAAGLEEPGGVNVQGRAQLLPGKAAAQCRHTTGGEREQARQGAVSAGLGNRSES